MMIHAYSNIYLEDAMNNLADAFDYAVNCYKLDIDYFMELFINSGYAKQFSDGNPKYLCGMSGQELVLHILRKLNIDIEPKYEIADMDLSEEYWVGWILAYYQWATNISFKYIHDFCKYLECTPNELFTVEIEDNEEEY